MTSQAQGYGMKLRSFTMTKRKYYPNNWKAYKDSPDNMFINHAYEDFMAWKIDGWELPNSVTCIIRAEEGGKIKEYTYQTQGHAKRRIERLVKNRQNFVVCDNDAIQPINAPK